VSLYDTPREPWLVRLMAIPCTCGTNELYHSDSCAIVRHEREGRPKRRNYQSDPVRPASAPADPLARSRSE
jgi:hypothetical protein